MAKLEPGVNDLATMNPAVAAEAYGWDPASVSPGSAQKKTWICPEGHIYETSINNRRKGRGCPVCSGKQILPGFNDLMSKYPEIASEAYGWDPSKITPGSNKKLLWSCPNGHEYLSSPNNRTRALTGCPYCSGKRVMRGFNDLSTTHPNVASEADGWDPCEVIGGSHKKMTWMCKEGHKWIAVVNSRTSGKRGCPICAGKEVMVGQNDLLTKFPKIASEAIDWDPSIISPGSGKRMRWKCSVHGNEWECSVRERAKGRMCPICAAEKKSIQTNTK